MNNSRIKWAITNNPLPLLEIQDAKIISAINSYLPYSCGIEIECDQPPHYNEEAFESIPDIMEIKSSLFEQRYRIPNGLKGLICLWNICEQCKINLELNEKSGHHYHLDFTDVYSFISDKNKLLKDNREWINQELEEWNYKGTYNHRESSWVRWNNLETLEFRIGNMTFDYDIIVKRLIHACDISRRLKILAKPYLLNKEELELEKLRKQLKEQDLLLNNMRPLDLEVANQSIKSRTIRL